MIHSELNKSSKYYENNSSYDLNKSFEIILKNHAFSQPLGLKEAVDLTSSTNASDGIQLLSLPETNDCHIMIRGGSGAGGYKIQKTLSFQNGSQGKQQLDTMAPDIKELYIYDILFLTGMGISTWLLRNILRT